MLGAIGAANILRRWGFSLRPRGQRGGTSTGASGGSAGALSSGLNSSGQQLEVQTKCGKCIYTRQAHKSAASTAQCSHPDQHDHHLIHHLPSSTDHSSGDLYPGQASFQLECLNERRKRKLAAQKQRLEQADLEEPEPASLKTRCCPHRRRRRKKEQDIASLARSGSYSQSDQSIHRYSDRLHSAFDLLLYWTNTIRPLFPLPSPPLFFLVLFPLRLPSSCISLLVHLPPFSCRRSLSIPFQRTQSAHIYDFILMIYNLFKWLSNDSSAPLSSSSLFYFSLLPNSPTKLSYLFRNGNAKRSNAFV